MAKGNYNEPGSTAASKRWMFFMILSAQIAGLIALILIIVLLGKYQGGFGWGSDMTKVFNYHPLFMVLGMVLFYGDAILVYRILLHVNKFWVKIVHASLLALSLIFSSIGLKAVFDSHKDEDHDGVSDGHNHADSSHVNLQSLHSWIGLAVVVLFGCQWVCGFVSFLFPKLSEHVRQAYLPSHKLWGKLIFLLAIGAVCMGIVEQSIYGGLYSKAESINQRRMMNFFGIFILIFAGIIFYLLDNPAFQRPTENDIEHVRLND